MQESPWTVGLIFMNKSWKFLYFSGNLKLHYATLSSQDNLLESFSVDRWCDCLVSVEWLSITKQRFRNSINISSTFWCPLPLPRDLLLYNGKLSNVRVIILQSIVIGTCPSEQWDWGWRCTSGIWEYEGARLYKVIEMVNPAHTIHQLMLEFQSVKRKDFFYKTLFLTLKLYDPVFVFYTYQNPYY